MPTATTAVQPQAEQATEHLDVVIVGAGLSGIGAAHHLQDGLPQQDLRDPRGARGDRRHLGPVPLPGHPLGLRHAHARLPLPAVDRRQGARRRPVDPRLRARHRARGGHRPRTSASATASLRAEWSTRRTRAGRSTSCDGDGEPVAMTCSFLYVLQRLLPLRRGLSRREFEGIERFAGRIVHPQFWPEDLDYAGKRVVVIGSGATAVTLVPAMADQAAHVTMLQRSPTLHPLDPRPRTRSPTRCGALLGDRLAYPITRWKNVALATADLPAQPRRPRARCKRLHPRAASAPRLPRRLRRRHPLQPALRPVGPAPVPGPRRRPVQGDPRRHARRWSPTRSRRFTERGIGLESGAELEADIVVTATGLNLLAFGGIELRRRRRARSRCPSTLAYKGMMLSGVPNFAFTIGYTNASWTLKADLVAEYVCRLLGAHGPHGCRAVRPGRRRPDGRAPAAARLRRPATSSARSTSSRRPGRARAVAAGDELRARRRDAAPPQRSRTACCASPPRRRQPFTRQAPHARAVDAIAA